MLVRANHHKVHAEVTCTLGHGNIALHEPYSTNPYHEETLPWAVLATLRVDFHFDYERVRFKVLKARVQLGDMEPTEEEVRVAYDKAYRKLEEELVAHGVCDVDANDLELHDCGITRWKPIAPPADLTPF